MHWARGMPPPSLSITFKLSTFEMMLFCPSCQAKKKRIHDGDIIKQSCSSCASAKGYDKYVYFRAFQRLYKTIFYLDEIVLRFDHSHGFSPGVSPR